jgi:hypothetical protein
MSKWLPPDDLDLACVSLCVALNALPGVETVGSCCGHGRAPFRIWLKLASLDSLGTITIARCLSGRYYNYAPGEKQTDPQWRLYLGDTDGPVGFVLEGKPMMSDTPQHDPAVKLARNLEQLIDELE